MLIQGDEFTVVPHKQWCNLTIVQDIDQLERLVGLLIKIKGQSETVNINILKYQNWLAAKLQEHFKTVTFHNTDSLVTLQDGTRLVSRLPPSFTGIKWFLDYQQQLPMWIIGPGLTRLENYYFRNGICVYDNLIHLLIMVKNAGEGFREVLKDNLPYIDYWTILDTGSTDNTIAIIQEVLKDVPGELYQEPFIDFKASRNRLLQLAGTKCKFNLMLDDTYVVKGELRKFLQEVRGDQYADSFSLFIRSDDVEYSSNRISKSEKGLRYIYRIHEVLQQQNNVNVMIPNTVTFIEDRVSTYMTTRTENRKSWDLRILFEEYQDNPNDPRSLYYIAQTYKCLKDWEKTYDYYLQRANHPEPGFLQEKIDAIFEAARTANFQLGYSWEICEKLYLWAYSLDTKRPDSLYFLGIHYYLENNKGLAYQYFRRAFEIGYPVHAQYSLKPTLSFTYLPKFLTELCYLFKNPSLGLESSKLYLANNKPDSVYRTQQDWHKIFTKMLLAPKPNMCPLITHQKLIVFCVDGNWSPWTGRDIESKGLGGSETWAVETASYLASLPEYQVYLFCNCSQAETYRGVHYRFLDNYLSFINDHNVEVAIVSRYSEWIPATYDSQVKRVYLWVHDIEPSTLVLPLSEKLRGIYCLTSWHAEYLKQVFPNLDIRYHYYGVTPGIIKEKIKQRFIYSSTANRGLVHLLEMWSDIRKVLPEASLEIYCDLDLAWAKQNRPQELERCKNLIKNYSDQGVIYRGWCSKAELSHGWSQAEYWLYPCTFKETFCLTALEAAAARVLPITNGLAALAETAANGIIIPGDPQETSWRQQVLSCLATPIDKDILDKNYQWALSLSWESQSKKLAEKILE